MGLLFCATRRALASRSRYRLNPGLGFRSTSEGNPVTDDEFRELFAKCDVYGNPGRTIGVAFSGGPDSTALLFLLQQLMTNGRYELQRNVHAIHVDHGLQAQSKEVSEHCASVARELGVEFTVVKIPWGVRPFPPLPTPGESFEAIARNARYHIFMDIMRKRIIDSIAFGHHCDDQVETAILRLSKGSSAFGLAGMRPLRRWGMGFGEDSSSLGWAGYEGMRKWIIRPLLSVSKERLVTTCEAHGLDYVLDRTNFQPAITERNSIRNDLKMLGDGGAMEARQTLPALKRLLSLTRIHCETGTNDIQSLTLSNLRRAVSLLSGWTAEVDTKATLALQACTLPTVDSTILLSCEPLRAINDNAIRVTMVRRILRFVSPRPWGSPAAEAGGRQTSLQAIVSKIWGLEPATATSLLSSSRGNNREAFVVGAGVQWTPVTILPSGDVRLRKAFAGEKEGWLVHRQPPILKRKKKGDFSSESSGKALDPLNLNITKNFFDALSKSTEATVLYDNRFIIHINPRRLLRHDNMEILQELESGNKPNVDVSIVPHSRFYLPRIIIVYPRDHPGRQGAEPQEIGRLSLRGCGRGRVESPSRSNNKIELTPLPSDAIRIDYARMDDAFDDISIVASCHVDGP